MKIDKIKISQLPSIETLQGFFTLGVGPDGEGCKADLGFIEDAAEVANHPATVGEDNHVYTWDPDSGEYIKTGIYVKGDTGTTAYESYLGGGGDSSVAEDEFNEMLSDLPGLLRLLTGVNTSLENRLNGE